MLMRINLILLFSLSSLASHAEKNENFINKMLSVRSRAVLTLEVYDLKGNLVDKGAGFFTSPTGVFLVSQHVLRKYLDNRKTRRIKITDKLGQTINHISFGRCGKKNNFDLCMLKAEKYKVTSYFPDSFLPKYPVTKEVPHYSMDIMAIGHCKRDYRLIRSKAKYYRKSEYLNKIATKYNKKDRGTIEEKDLILLHKPHCTGDSGGPIFNLKGELVGVLQERMFNKDDGSDNYYIGLAVSEITPFLNRGANFRKIPSGEIIKGKKKLSSFNRRGR